MSVCIQGSSSKRSLTTVVRVPKEKRMGLIEITGLISGTCVELEENYFFLSPELVPCLCVSGPGR